MDKKKIFAIAIFFLMGFFMFAFANPSEDNKAKEKVKKKNQTNEVVTSSERTNVTNEATEVNPAPVLAVAAPVADFGVGGTDAPVVPTVNPTPSIIDDAPAYVDTVKPVIELIGGNVVLRIGDTYEELGAVATDNVDGNITNNIVISGEVKNEKGEYTINYNVKDEAGNAADEVSRIVYVVDTKELVDAIDEGNEILNNDNTSRNEELNNLLEELENEISNGDEVLENEIALQNEVDEETNKINDIIEKIKNLTFTVTFVDYDDSEISKQTVKYYESAVVPTNPTRFGYTFTKWNGKYTNVVDNYTVKAEYSLDTYTITYNDELKAENNNVKSYTVNKIELISDLQKLGYTFGGFTYNGKTVKSTEGYAENLNLFANWTINNYKVTLDPDNGETYDDINYTILDTVRLPQPTKEGYKFIGWYDGDAKVESVITGDYNLKAKYEIIDYTITYVDELNVENTNETSYNVENNVTINDLSKAGYTFNGWFNGNTKVTSTEGYTENLTLTASWTLENYRITYNYNDGTLEEGKSNITEYNVNTVFTLNNPSKENYTFIGWFNGEEKIEKIENMTGELTLNAVYQANQTGINAELKTNTFLQFNKGTDVNVKDYINVYPVYADGTVGDALAQDEYTIEGFTTASVTKSADLTVKQGDFEDILTYSIVNDEAVQTKFEVVYQSKKYVASSEYCYSGNCDKKWTSNVKVNKPILEVIEHYDQLIGVNSVVANYGGDNNVTLNIKKDYYGKNDSVRWTKISDNEIWNPVYITSIGVLNSREMKDVDINNLKTVTINYTRTFKERRQKQNGYGYETVTYTKNFVVVFENRDGIFVAIDEYEV